jgi:S1-C subfamily serine protease
MSDGLADAVDRAGTSVVTVDGRRRLAASGIAWADGVIVTASHVVERDENLSVTLGNGARVDASIAGRDRGSDIAVLRVPATGGAVAERAPGGSARVGQLALAVGRPGSGGVMASMGLVGAVGGPWRTGRGTTVSGYLQADVTMYPGFSGGPLIDVAGRVLGMNSSHLARGGGLTVPANAIDTIVADLLAKGRVRRGYLGIATQAVSLPDGQRAGLPDGQETGLLISGVEPGSPSEVAGMLVGDVLVALGGVPVTDTDALFDLLGSERVGETLTARVMRGGTGAELSITVGERE